MPEFKMNKKFFRPMLKPVLVLLLTSVLFLLSSWSGSFISKQLDHSANELKKVKEIHKQLEELPNFEAKIDSIKEKYTPVGLFWKNTEKMWEASVKALALKHHILHLNHTAEKKDLIFTHTFEMEAAHDYNILGFVHEFFGLKMGYIQVQTFVLHLPNSPTAKTTGILIFNRMMWDD